MPIAPAAAPPVLESLPEHVPPAPEAGADRDEQSIRRRSTLPAGFQDDERPVLDDAAEPSVPVRVRVREPEGPVAQIDLPEFIAELHATPRPLESLTAEPIAFADVVPLAVPQLRQVPAVEDWPQQGVPWNIVVTPGATAAR